MPRCRRWVRLWRGIKVAASVDGNDQVALVENLRRALVR
jgi:hypothetical protein